MLRMPRLYLDFGGGILALRESEEVFGFWCHADAPFNARRQGIT
jgi:hypothetical protein